MERWGGGCLAPRLSGGHTWMWRGIVFFSSQCGPGIFKAKRSQIEEVGEGDPAFLAGRGLMGPPQGVCRVRLSPLPMAPPWRGGGAELPRAGAGRAPRVRVEGWRGCGSWLGLLPCTPPPRPLRDKPKCGCWRRVRARQGCCPRSSAWSSRLLAAPHTPLPGACAAPYSLVCLK